MAVWQADYLWKLKSDGMNNCGISIKLGESYFRGIAANDEYCVDKTLFIRSIYEDGGKVSLYTRPHRFGKTFMLNVLQTFFELDYADPQNRKTSQELFSGYLIGRDADFCAKHLAQHPVIFVSFKDAAGLTFESAAARLRSTLVSLFSRYDFLAYSSRLTESDQRRFVRLLHLYSADLDTALALMRDSLALLEELLCRHFGRRVITLIDDYDLPLGKALQNNYYTEMLELIRAMLSSALSDNPSLEKAVLTGWLGQAKESIFKDFSQFVCNSMSSPNCSAAFGFTANEVKQVFQNFGLQNSFDDAKAYYGGYKFGDEEVFCPWDLMNFCRDSLIAERTVFDCHWSHTSTSDILSEFIECADESHLELLQKMLKGEKASAAVTDYISISELHANRSSSFLLNRLFAAGYLTRDETDDAAPSGEIFLRIPNREMHVYFRKQIDKFFSQEGTYFRNTAIRFTNAVCEADAFEADSILKEFFVRFASLQDGNPESLCHDLVLRLLSAFEYSARVNELQGILNLSSNSGSGCRYSDISFEDAVHRQAVILAFMQAPESGATAMHAASQAALKHLHECRYAEEALMSGLSSALLCGIAVSGKNCLILMEKVAL